jgi:hypothetical protein
LRDWRRGGPRALDRRPACVVLLLLLLLLLLETLTLRFLAPLLILLVG